MQLDDKSFNTFTFLDTRPWFPPAFLNVNTPMFHGNASTFQGAICAPMTEGGEFAGSNRFKHMMTGMAHMKWTKEGDRTFFFSKNRRGGDMSVRLFNLSISSLFVNPIF